MFVADGDDGKTLYLQALFGDLLFAAGEFFGVVDKQEGFVIGEVVRQFVLPFPRFEFLPGFQGVVLSGCLCPPVFNAGRIRPRGKWAHSVKK